MKPLLHLLWSLSLAGGCAAFGVLALLPLTKRRLPARWQYTLLRLPLLFFALPTGPFAAALLPELPQAAMPSLARLYPADSPQPLPAGGNTEGLANAAGAYEPAFFTLLALIWGGGAILSLIISLSGLIRFQAQMRRTSAPVTEPQMLLALEEAMRQTGARAKPLFWENPCLATPMLVFCGKTAIVLPRLEWDSRELLLVLRHELTHCRHGDLRTKWFLGILRTVFWFHPAVHLLARAIHRWMELACDEAVIRDLTREERICYGETILSVLSRGRGALHGLSVALCERQNDMKARLTAILKTVSANRRGRYAAIALVAMVCAGGLLIGAASYPPEEDADILSEVGVAGRPSDDAPADVGESSNDPIEPVDSSGGFIRPTNTAAAPTTYRNHSGNGIDYKGDEGDPVFATAGGIVVRVVNGYTGYGHYLIVDHGDGYQSLYAQCSEIIAAVGDEVVMGQVIARIGSTGWSTGHHLHFEIRYNGEFMDPMEYVGRE